MTHHRVGTGLVPWIFFFFYTKSYGIGKWPNVKVQFIRGRSLKSKQCGPFIPGWSGLSQGQCLEAWRNGWYWSLQTLLYICSALDKDHVALKWRSSVWAALPWSSLRAKWSILSLLCWGQHWWLPMNAEMLCLSKIQACTQGQPCLLHEESLQCTYQ